jgi:hypothetical protein
MMDGKYEGAFIRGLYFEHILVACRFFLFTIIYATVVCFISLAVFVYWGKVKEDWVGASNIGAFITCIGVVGLAVASSVPSLWL